MLDNLMIRAVEQAFGFGFPTEAGAVLIIEVDGLEAGLDREAAGHRRDRPGATAATVQKSITWRTRKEPEYVAIWKSRKSAFGAIGRLSPTFCTQDGVVPRTKLPHILRHHRGVGERYDLRIANVFHAGDGNIHPILLFDERDPEQVKRVLEASHEILDECIALGGSVTGEHGIGVKMAVMPAKYFPRRSVGDGRAAPRIRSRSARQPEQDHSGARLVRGSNHAAPARRTDSQRSMAKPNASVLARKLAAIVGEAQVRSPAACEARPSRSSPSRATRPRSSSSSASAKPTGWRWRRSAPRAHAQFAARRPRWGFLSHG